MMLSQFQSRGRAYRCRQCNKVERKSRLERHILKTHIPMDRVPYYCTLCLFRCEDKETLAAHIKKYKRHRDEESRSGVPDYSKILKKAEHPIFVSERDMVVLSQEESFLWHACHLLAEDSNETDAVFMDEEDPTTILDGLVMPGWMVPDNPVVSSIPPYVPSARTIPLQPTKHFRQQTGFSGPAQNELVSVDPKDLASILSQVDSHPQLTATAKLNTPTLQLRSPSVNFSTPCQDENEDLLPGLLVLNQEDPLLQEAQGTSATVPASNGPVQPEDQEDAPTPKRRKVEEVISPALTAITNAIADGTKGIIEAINANTRALRCQEKTLSQVVSKLARIERKMAMLERSTPREKENHNRTLKSIAKKV